MQHQEDDKALAWTMDLIAKEELYKTTFTDSKSSSGMHLTAEMTDWLRSNLQASLPGLSSSFPFQAPHSSQSVAPLRTLQVRVLFLAAFPKAPASK